MARTPIVPRPGALALAGLAGLALGACGSSQTTSSTPASSAPVVSRAATPGARRAGPGRACSASQLKLVYSGTDGATGHMEVTLALRNVSARACTVKGYPGARLLDASGRTLPMHVRRGRGFFPDTLRAPRAVTLGPGARAHFGLSFVTNNEYQRAHVCRSAAAVTSRAPGAASWLHVSLLGAPRVSPCGGQLVLSPLHT